jgi:hypothetical protein
MRKSKRPQQLCLAASGRVIISANPLKTSNWKRAVPLYKPARMATLPKHHKPLEGQLSLFPEDDRDEGSD